MNPLSMRGLLLGWGVILLGGCPGASAPSNPPPARAMVEAGSPLHVAPSSIDFSGNPKLAGRLTGSAHNYFRFINPRFCREVCRRFKSAVRTMPTLNLHGDPHLEQYAVTSLGRGLTDFDDSTSGPGIVDLVRFGVSVSLTCRQRGWGAQIDQVLDAFLAGYRQGLSKPGEVTAEPDMAARIRTAFKRDTAGFYKWIDSLMKPLAVDRAKLVAAFARYAAQIRERQPELPEHFFKVRRVGTLHKGIGSALDEKYLIRVEGPTAAPDDDVVLEAKEVRPPSGASCVNRVDMDPFRIMVVQSRIAYRPYRYLGYMQRGGRMLWVHEWMELYKQLDIQKKKYLATPGDLVAVARDVGRQLGRGHTNQIAAPLGAQVRQRQLELVNELEPRIRENVAELERMTIAAWEQFKKAMPGPP